MNDLGEELPIIEDYLIGLTSLRTQCGMLEWELP